MTGRTIFRAVCAVAVSLCAGCATTLVRETPQAIRAADARVETVRLAEGLLDLTGTRVTAARGSWKEHAFSAQCVMKGDGETLRVVFLAPQMRLATLTLTRPHTIQFERAPQIPRAFEPEYALADFAYVNLDTETLRRAVVPALTVADDGRTRRIATAGGTPVATVARAANGDTEFTHHIHGYSYTLRPVQ